VPGIITTAADILNKRRHHTPCADHLHTLLTSGNPTASRTLTEISLCTRLGQAPEVMSPVSPALSAIVQVRACHLTVSGFVRDQTHSIIVRFALNDFKRCPGRLGDGSAYTVHQCQVAMNRSQLSGHAIHDDAPVAGSGMYVTLSCILKHTQPC
jgi:hypothetical protein